MDCLLPGQRHSKCVKFYWIFAKLNWFFPGEHGVKRSPFFCFSPLFWCKSKPVDKVPLPNGGSVGSLAGDEGMADFEPVPREMKGKEAIRIVDLHKRFKVSSILPGNLQSN